MCATTAMLLWSLNLLKFGLTFVARPVNILKPLPCPAVKLINAGLHSPTPADASSSRANEIASALHRNLLAAA
ncbi:hypothetical protein AOQ84DRAFT_352798 [Glonium stellatum]|uniref:Secreted protein n=1 Tax=Glonium stellatum TaxID=574774 RepID=A0A8E2JWB3_9PEZI|nr:hypothetical protein AOQ84DRAFT_352798 [Glonium stellatum]